ncbi:MAG: c-type cytochrome [Enterobacterales bacterium]|nr:c-type cytochrome [Enterobacterales bacterium]
MRNLHNINQTRKTKIKAMKPFKLLLTSTLLVLAGCSQTSNQEASGPQVESGATSQNNLPATYSIGKPVAAEVIAGWDIDVRPDGMGLPEGSGSVEDGETLFEDKCSMCHGSFGEGVDAWPKLAGGADTLTEARPEKTIGSFWPYASTLWDYIHRAMPFPAPQSLSADETYAITAYVLYLNDIVEDDFVLSKANFTSIEMPNKDGFYVDDRPDTNNTRCMKDCKDATSIKVILGPKYSLGNTEAVTKSAETKTEHPGRSIYEGVCKVCHGSGVAGAPKLDDAEQWASRISKGNDVLYSSALEGLNAMPAKGGRTDLSDEAVKQAVDFMLHQINQ